MREINFLNVFFDVESEYEVDFPTTLTVFALKGEAIIISDPVDYYILTIFCIAKRVIRIIFITLFFL